MSAEHPSARRKFAAPTVAMLPRIADSLSFLYLDIVRIVQDSTGVCAEVETEKRGIERVYLPTASLSCVLLGPGTSITQPALATFARHGTTVVCTGSGGVRSYAGITPGSMKTHWLERQVRLWADDNSRLDVAKQMYIQRFDEDAPSGTTLAQLRGFEGQRMKALYRILSDQYKIGRFRRNYDPKSWDDQDPVNLALSSANQCLYGIVHAALLALGCSPGLGFVHSGKQNSFIYDVADLYKAQLTVPLAFSLHDSGEPEREARRRFREDLRLFRLLPAIVTDVQRLLDPDAVSDEAAAEREEVELVSLWDPAVGDLSGGVNYG